MRMSDNRLQEKRHECQGRKPPQFHRSIPLSRALDLRSTEKMPNAEIAFAVEESREHLLGERLERGQASADNTEILQLVSVGLCSTQADISGYVRPQFPG